MPLSQEQIEDIETKMSNWYTHTYKKTFGEREFELPIPYREFLLKEAPDVIGQRPDLLFNWYTHNKNICHETRSRARFWDRILRYPPLREKNAMWLAIARHCDKEWVETQYTTNEGNAYQTWICCDKGHENFGHVASIHYKKGPWDLEPDWLVYEDFVSYYKMWNEVHKGVTRYD